MRDIGKEFYQFCTGRCSECEYFEVPSMQECAACFGYKEGVNDADGRNATDLLPEVIDSYNKGKADGMAAAIAEFASWVVAKYDTVPMVDKDYIIEHFTIERGHKK